MAVVIETTIGDITVDLYLDQRPVTCLNFLKLCKMKYYNYNLFHTIRSGFIAQTGDPSGEGSGGQSIFGLLEGPTKRFFSGEKMPKIRHTNAGLLSMVCTDDMMVGSQFFFTLAPDLDSLDGVHCVIGEVTEGHEVLRKLNEVICDENHRPYQDVRITHTVVLEDPFNDPVGFRAPSRSPSPSAERLKGGRIAPDEEIDETEGKSAAEIQEMIEEKEAKARATILEIVGDLPDADIAPPENVLFVCKLNPVTTDEDLEIIFSRFGKIVSCEVIRDKKSGDSLQYAFIEFSDKKSCEDAYFKMDNVLIDDRRIHVDFSQSVSKMRWLGKGRGVKYFNDDEDTKNSDNNLKTGRSQTNDRARSGHNNHYNEKNKYKKYDEKTYSNNHQEKRHTSDKNSRKCRERSRSRSKPRASEDSKDDRNNSYSHNSRYKEKSSGEISHKNRDHDTNTHKSKSKYSDNTNSHKSRSKLSPTKHKRESSKSPSRSNKDDSRSFRESDDKHKRKEKNELSNIRQNKGESQSRLKQKQTDAQSESNLNRKKTRIDQDAHEPRTPSPVTKKNRSEKNKRNKKRTSNAKKKRKPSTSSSDSDSSDSSSSSSDSSSSEDRRKKNKLKRRRRHSSSSSSTDSSHSSSSSSTSSDSSSDSSSSSSDSEPNRRKKSKKSLKTNMTKKSKKK